MLLTLTGRSQLAASIRCQSIGGFEIAWELVSEEQNRSLSGFRFRGDAPIPGFGFRSRVGQSEFWFSLSVDPPQRLHSIQLFMNREINKPGGVNVCGACGHLQAAKLADGNGNLKSPLRFLHGHFALHIMLYIQYISSSQEIILLFFISVVLLL